MHPIAHEYGHGDKADAANPVGRSDVGAAAPQREGEAGRGNPEHQRHPGGQHRGNEAGKHGDSLESTRVGPGPGK